MEKPPTPFACDMSAIEPSERPRHLAVIRELFQDVDLADETADGYAFRLRDEPGVLSKCSEFITNERRCCPFFGFELRVEPEGGPVWLRLTGRDGVKPFIAVEIGDALPDSVAEGMGFR